MKTLAITLLATVALLPQLGAADDSKARAKTVRMGWGTIEQTADLDLAYRRVITVSKWPGNRLLDMPVPFSNIVSGGCKWMKSVNPCFG